MIPSIGGLLPRCGEGSPLQNGDDDDVCGSFLGAELAKNGRGILLTFGSRASWPATPFAETDIIPEGGFSSSRGGERLPVSLMTPGDCETCRFGAVPVLSCSEVRGVPMFGEIEGLLCGCKGGVPDRLPGFEFSDPTGCGNGGDRLAGPPVKTFWKLPSS